MGRYGRDSADRGEIKLAKNTAYGQIADNSSIPDRIEIGRFFPWELRTLPLYPYRCTQCGHKFEKIQSFKSEPEKVCPKCGGVLERPLTVPGFNFKGAGWYVNDYASKGSSGSDSSDSSSSSESKTSDSKTGDSKTGDSGSKPAPAETKSPSKTETASASPAASSTNS
jgi:putative FmdB family regulatory protein